ncbi:hypothetical protein [Halosolutus gelatinilyticus]|uniref:hypothetical protein n=1 Tax=Halosolutus gelatinilyticus TaxID=2931975 RepID=UPI001FF62779|nr:hypothetical protein [Halosolutus gelatinilyticus]
MPTTSTADGTPGTDDPIVEAYVLGVRIVDVDGAGERYRFEAPDHVGVAFEDLSDARLYADVYFDVNGFVEEGTGDRGVPPEIIQGGKDTLAAYLITRPWADVNWVASFYGAAPEEIERYVSWVHRRAEGIRETVRDRDLE